jgi:hypothetical protein
MKTKIILLAALLGATALSANAGVRFGFSIGLPVPVMVSPPVVYSAPVAVVQTTSPCPGVGYVWTPGYWSVYPTGRVWVPGAWHYRPTYVVYGHNRDARHDRHDAYRGHDRNGHNRDGHGR